MPQGQYTFGPPGGVSQGQPPPMEKKQTFTFGPPGVKPQVGAGGEKPPAPAIAAKPPVVPPVAPATSQAPPQMKPPVKPGEQPGFMSGLASGAMLDAGRIAGAGKVSLGGKLYDRQHPMVAQGAEVVKQAAKGMSEWMNAVYDAPTVGKLAGELHKPVTVPLENLARMVEFHTGTKWDAFGLHKAGVDETALEEIIRGYKENNSTTMANGAGKIVGALASVMALEKSPEAGEKLVKLPGELRETASIVKESSKKNQSVVTAAANNTLHNDVKTSIAPAIARNVEVIKQGIARDAQAVIAKDKAASVASGTSAFKAHDVATAFGDAVKNKSATKAPLPQTKAVLKSFLQTVKKHGPDLSWEDLKDLRSQTYEAMNSASLKDRAVLGQVNDWAGKQLAGRAKAVGAGDEFTKYSESQTKLRNHQDGIIKSLQNADTGLKTYQELAKASNKPQLNDFFHLGEQYGGVPASFVDEMVKTRKPIYELAKRADGGDATGGRMGALLRHPMAAGTAMVGTGVGLSLSPIPITGAFEASLVAAQKAANFMDRYDAVKAMRSIKNAPSNSLQGMPTPFSGGANAPTPPQGGAPVTPLGAAPSPTRPVAPPTAPAVTASGPVSPSVGAPAAPASLTELMDRISKAQRPPSSTTSEPVVKPPVSLSSGDRRLSRSEFNPMKQANIDRLRGIIKDKSVDLVERTKAELTLKDILEHPEDEPIKGDLKSLKKPTAKMSEAEALAEQAKRHGEEPAKAESAKQTPYEEFGVKIDKSRLTTPEAVREAKADAKRQIEELGRAKYTDAAKLPVGPERTAALDALRKDVAKASRSVDKMQTPEVSRKQRDVLRKAVDAGKIKPAERSVLEGLSPDEVEQKAKAGVTDDEAGMMELIDLGREAEEMGGQVERVYNEIYKKTGGDVRTSLPLLRALMDQVRKAKLKKPAAD